MHILANWIGLKHFELVTADKNAGISNTGEYSIGTHSFIMDYHFQLNYSNFVQFSFQQNKTPLEGGNTEHSGCLFCDQVFKNLIELKHAAAKRRRGGGGGRGGGRGRGGRGRGRGRGKVPKDKMAQLAAYFV